MAIEGLCPSCANSIWCPTWTEWKCKDLKKRIYGYTNLTSCNNYTKRDKNFKEPKCQCKFCLVNEKLLDDLEV